MRLALPLSILAALILASPATAATPKPSKTCDFLDTSVCLYPFPNDFFRKGGKINFSQKAMPPNKGGKRMDPARWNRNDGFSPGQTILTTVKGLDLDKSRAVQLKDLSRYDAKKAPIVVINARTRKRHMIWAELDPVPTKASDIAVQIRPATNWDEGERYIVALRNLKNSNGKTLKAGKAFRLYRDRITQENKLVEGRRKHMESIFKKLGKAGIKRKSLYLAWDFTVASEKNLSERVLHMRDESFEQLGDTNLADGVVQGNAPSFTVTGSEVVADEPGVAQRITGTFQVPCWLDSADCGVGSKFAYDSNRSNLPKRGTGMRIAPFYCNVPAAANASGKTLAVQYGHGLLGSGDQVFDEEDIQDMAEEHNAMYCATDWTGFSRLDAPYAISVLQEDLSRFSNMTDRMQQGFLDQMFLGRLMVHPMGFASNAAFQSNGKAFFDNSTLYFDSNSQGGIMGGALTALSPDFENAVLGVPAMNYSVLLRRSVDFDAYAIFFDEGYPDQTLRPLELGLIQMLWDRGENNGFAHHIVGDPLAGTRDHRVLLHPAVGDHQVTTIQVDVMARTIGASVRQPALDPGRSLEAKPLFGIPAIESFPFSGRAALVYWDTGPDRGTEEEPVGTDPAPLGEEPNRSGRDPHAGPRRAANGRVQKVEWLTNGQLIDTCGTDPCYAFGWTGP